MLERVVAVLARGFPMPRKFTSVRHGRAGMLAIHLELAELEPERTNYLAARLRALVGVEQVFVSMSDDRVR